MTAGALGQTGWNAMNFPAGDRGAPLGFLQFDHASQRLTQFHCMECLLGLFEANHARHYAVQIELTL
jgi:hypothetical protein